MLEETHPIARRRSMELMNGRASEQGYTPIWTRIESAERDLATTEDDLWKAQDRYRELVAEHTRTHDGRERNASPAGQDQIDEAARQVADLSAVADDCRSYRDGLVAEKDAAYRPLPRLYPGG